MRGGEGGEGGKRGGLGKVKVMKWKKEKKMGIRRHVNVLRRETRNSSLKRKKEKENTHDSFH